MPDQYDEFPIVEESVLSFYEFSTFTQITILSIKETDVLLYDSLFGKYGSLTSDKAKAFTLE